MKKIIFRKPAYPFKHWFATLALAPLMLFGLALIKDPGGFSDDAPGWYAIYFAAGIFFSFPTFIIYYIGYVLLERKKIAPVFIKIILNAEAILGVYITLNFIGGSLSPDLYIPYFVSVIVSSFFIKTDDGDEKTGPM